MPTEGMQMGVSAGPGLTLLVVVDEDQDTVGGD